MQCRAVRIDLLTLIAAVLTASSNARFSPNSMKMLSPHSSCTSGDSGPTRRDHVSNRRQFFKLDGDCGGDVFRFGASASHAHCDHLADVPHLSCREHGLDRILESLKRRGRNDRFDADEIARGEDRVRGDPEEC